MHTYLLGLKKKWNRFPFPFRSMFLICLAYLLWHGLENYLPRVMGAFLDSSAVEWFTRLHSSIFGVLFSLVLPFSVEQTDSLFRLENGILLRIVWGCTALKVICVFFFAQIFYYRPSVGVLKTLGWTLLLIFLLNMVRVYLTFLAYQYIPHYGVLAHDLMGKSLYVFVYLFWYAYDGQITKKTELETTR